MKEHMGDDISGEFMSYSRKSENILRRFLNDITKLIQNS